MAFVSAVTGDDCTKKFMEVLQNDFRNLSAETKKKYPQIRESCDEAVEKLTLASNNPQASLYGVINQILYPLVQGCESKDLKIIKFCVGTIQRLIYQQAIDAKGARHIVDCLTNLGQSGVLELKLLQTAALLMTTSHLVHGDTLARTLVLCLRMQNVTEWRDASTCHAAAATVRQLVALVFERAVAECHGDIQVIQPEMRVHQVNNKAPKDLKPCAADAYLILQDIIQLINGDQAHWLVGITEISKTFGLELLETVLTDFSTVFFEIQEFRFILKEHVCALIIRLFSPNVKYRAAFTSAHIPGAASPHAANVGTNGQPSPTSPSGPERPHFPVSMRLLRLVSVIMHKYHSVLVTECEIFLSLTIKFLDPDKPLWQRALALEVLHRMSIRPDLLSSFCECYDLRPHATNIFQDIVNALGAYVQSLLVSTQPTTGVGATCVPQQSGFYWKGVWLPLCITFDPGTAKAIYLEMLDRTEAPTIQEGYGISVAYACLSEIIASIAITVEGADYAVLYWQQDDDCCKELLTMGKEKGELEETHNEKRIVNGTTIHNEEKENELHLQLIKSSWCGLVWGLSVLAEASVGELENILQCIQTLAVVSGKVGHWSGRDACFSALCRAALPAHYCLPALGALPCPWRSGRDSSSGPPYDPADYQRHQVVAVGTPLPSASMPVGQQQSFVMVSARHVTAMKALLWTARRHGHVIQQAWHPVLTTLQHLVWILGLKPSTGGSMQAGRGSSDANAVMSTTAVMADLPTLSVMLSQVFESSKRLDDVALHHLIDGLCKLSNEAMELAYSNRKGPSQTSVAICIARSQVRGSLYSSLYSMGPATTGGAMVATINFLLLQEPSLFAVAKLLETGLANLYRVDVMWRPITNHLLDVCQHPHIRMREWGVEAITYLVQAALAHHHKNPGQTSEGTQRLLLEPLSELCSVRHPDVRSKQLECAARLLHSRGDQLGAGWPLMMNIIAAISEHHGEMLIRMAFQCVQLVVADLLAAAGPRCLRRIISAAAAFAKQTQDLNISLTAVGLMWNISDYFFHNRASLSAALNGEAGAFPELPQQHGNLAHADKLWMCLYIKLSELCTEARAPVRRAASQTLFSCVGAHGALLPPLAWRALLSAALFPTLHKVQTLSNVASSEKVDTGEHILIHHTRNTAQKQWAETQVLTLSGVARVFHSRFQMLQSIGDFQRAWTILLDFITDFALRRSHEVSLAALKSLQEVLSAAGRPLTTPETPADETVSHNLGHVLNSEGHKQIWATAWAAWAKIAKGAALDVQNNIKTTSNQHDGVDIEAYMPSQAFLTALIQIFPVIFQNVRTSFTPADVHTLGVCLSRVCALLSAPRAPWSAAESMLMATSAAPLHSHALHCLELVQKEALVRKELLSPVFAALLQLSSGPLASPEPCASTVGPQAAPVSPMGPQVESRASARTATLSAAVRLYRASASDEVVVATNVLADLIQALHESVKRGAAQNNDFTIKNQSQRPDSPEQSSEKQQQELSSQTSALLLQLLATGLPLAREKPDKYATFWERLPPVLECFMFDGSVQGSESSRELVLLVRDEVLGATATVPRGAAAATLSLLRRGSLHTALHDTPSTDTEADLKCREEFARSCFETLLQFSMLDSINEFTDEKDGPLAIATLLERFEEVVRRHNQEALDNSHKSTSAATPTPSRQKLAEISFVLKAIATLADSMKKAPTGKVEKEAWTKLIGLYPYLVECAALSNNENTGSALREALLQYRDLIRPPFHS